MKWYGMTTHPDANLQRDKNKEQKNHAILLN